jgi:anti-sigma factor RsiW
MHLNDEQLDDLIHGHGPEPDHLAACDACRVRLAQRRALAERLQSAFTSVEAGSDIRSRILAAVQSASASAAPPRRSRLRRRLWSALAAAAVIALCVIPLSIFRHTGSQVQASQLELSGIHHLTLDHPEKLFHDQDPNRMADHLQQATGCRPALIGPCEHWVICGSRSCTFRGRAVPTYMVESASGKVSVLTLSETPGQLGLQRDPVLETWTATCRCCQMAAVQLGKETCLAVGDVTQEVLQEVLNRIQNSEPRIQ